MAKVYLCGEPMVLFQAEELGDFHTTSIFSKHIVGAELNVAIGLRRLGHEVLYQTKLGNDLFGHDIARFLMSEQIGTCLSFTDKAQTGFQVKNKVAHGDPEVVYFRKGSAASTMMEDELLVHDLKEVDWLHITGVFPALSASCKAYTLKLMKMAKQAGVKISFDPNIRFELWEREDTMVETLNEIAAFSDVVLPGILEGQKLSGQSQPEAICDFYLQMGVDMVVLKDGANGSLTKTAEAMFYTKSEPTESIIDTVGAGDGFAVGIISGLLEGIDLKAVIRRANVIGAMQIEKIGDNDGLPTRSELMERVKNEKD